MKFLLERKAARYGLLLGTALLNISWTFGSLYIDSHRYLRVASFFLGVVEASSFDPTTMSYFVFRPLVPFLASLLSPFVGLENGFALVSSVFWLGSAILLFHFTRQLTGSETVGFWTALLFNFSVPVLMFGAALMTDMASWFFLTLGLYLLASWRTQGSLLWFGAVGLVAGVGILARQTVLALVVVGVLIVLSLGRKAGRKDLARLGLFLLFALLPATLWTSYIGRSPLVYYEHAILGTLEEQAEPLPNVVPWETPFYRLLGVEASRVPMLVKVPVRYAVSFSAAFHGALILVVVRWRDSLALFRKLGLWPLLLATAAALLARPFLERRLAFVLFPVILPLAAAHSTKLGSKGMLFVFASFITASCAIIYLFPWN